MDHVSVLEIHDNRLKTMMHGIPYSFFDRSEHLGIWGIGQMFGASRQLFWTKMIQSMSFKGSGYLIVISRQKLTLTPSFQENINLLTEINLVFDVSVVEVGNSSYTMMSRLTDMETGQEYGRGLTLFVRLDSESRRPISLPEEFKVKFKPSQQSSQSIWTREKFPEKNEFYKKEFKVRHSDQDALYHVNNIMYTQFCIDCATDAAKCGFYRNYDTDMCQFPVLELDFRFLGESRANDILSISTWQDLNNCQKIFFQVERDNTPITQATFIFGLNQFSSH